ncbi:MAG TPA: 30S ribosomal protein S16 [Candidatus Caccalectryoclostridium excrementigallinarum]|uniref:Small ribosomal subunit protein bS16 n=1 Tax=Candidatus Caccalectryoclostridium excrementigallinarum TaxID=2840710 RepID=A0A9D1SKQ7_9FIRM|nr:30S ribosomal protein S16 [Candidatus Caccalectryoclostridium excrementigallinarum]
MVKIRLTRMGSKKAPFYRIVAIDSRKARDAQYLDNIGYYDPTKEPAVVKIDTAKATEWLERGAQPTDTVRSIFKQQEIIK